MMRMPPAERLAGSRTRERKGAERKLRPRAHPPGESGLKMHAETASSRDYRVPSTFRQNSLVDNAMVVARVREVKGIPIAL
jgi:hypothetical protein